MKRLVLFICLATIAFGVRAATEYRDFTNAEGKTIRGAVVAYDVGTKTVTIERENKRKSKVPITVFSEADQTYILEWDAARGFMSESLLKITCDRKRGDKRKEEKWADVTYSSGAVENELVTVTTYENILFAIELYYGSESDLKDIRMEYKIYYEQSEETWEKLVVKQEILSASASIPMIASRKKTTITTKPVEIHKDSINQISSVSDRMRTGGKGEVHGIRARIYMKMPSGNEVMREFSCPDKLSREKFPWKG